MADLDNYAYPLASQLKDPGLVSVWCTKQHSEQIHAAVAGPAELPAGPVRLQLAFVVGPGRNWLTL
jgi:hypothetical protein